MVITSKIEFLKYLKSVSYALLFLSFTTLIVTGSIGLLTAPIFLSFFFLSWYLESTEHQLSEGIALILIIATIPIYFVCWKAQLFDSVQEQSAVNALAYLIVTIGLVKLLQKKSDRDWIFLYLISFFQVLLASGTSISPFFFLFLVIYTLLSVSSIIAFEMSKTYKLVSLENVESKHFSSISAFKLPIISIGLLLLIVSFAMPIFFSLPRIGGAGMSSTNKLLTGTVGFSSSVELGKIGQLQPNLQTVMRIQVDNENYISSKNRKWRGIALDEFNNKFWRKSNFSGRQLIRNSDDVFTIKEKNIEFEVSLQKIILEGTDTPVLFSLSNPMNISGDMDTVLLDSDDSISTISDSERLVYSVNSIISSPTSEVLARDNTNYSAAYSRYLQLPEMDNRIEELSKTIVKSKNATSRYEKSVAIESYLKNTFSYTLDLKAGGDEPLTDFLFDKKAGHCEYFASALAIMLRTQGVATRIVNGFQFGEYNQNSNIYIVKQKDAHSWVEVYFPETDSWIPFDATPFSGLNSGQSDATFYGKLSGYIESLETFWIQNFISYDKKNQRSLFKSVKMKFTSYQNSFSAWMSEMQKYIVNWWNDLRGEKGFEARLYAIMYAIGLIVLTLVVCSLSFFLGRKIWRLKLWQKAKRWFGAKPKYQIVEFYDRMTKALEKQGFTRANHQTPLEFVSDLNIPEAMKITEDYQRVRFGNQTLSNSEMDEIEIWLREIETKK
jgi:protein-glutamine gamma-glutamyltransferase